MITLRQYKWEDALEVLKNPSQPSLGITENTVGLAKRKETSGPALTGEHSGRVIGCAGIEIVWPGMGQVWCVFAHDIQKYAMQLARILKPTVRQWMEEYELVRLQADLRADFSLGIRMAEWIGFEKEGLMRKYHADGCDAAMYAIVGE